MHGVDALHGRPCLFGGPKVVVHLDALDHEDAVFLFNLPSRLGYQPT